MRLPTGLLLFALSALLVSPVFADEYPTLSYSRQFPMSATAPEFLEVAIPEDTALFEAGQQLSAEIHRAAEVTHLDLHYAFDLNVTAPHYWSFQDPIWSVEQAPEAMGGVVYSRGVLESAMAAVDPDTFAREMLPYLAFRPHADLALARIEGIAGINRMTDADVLCGWWLGQQPGATRENLEAIAYWRSDAVDEIWQPLPYLRAGFDLRDQSWEEILRFISTGIVGPHPPTSDNLAPAETPAE